MSTMLADLVASVFSPTAEQDAAVEGYLSGKSMKVKAFAGSGKTSTLKLMAKAKISPAIYMCFNKAIADQSSKVFPEHVACRTTHSLAYRAMANRYNRDGNKMTNSLRARDTAHLLGIKDIPIFGNSDKLDSSTVAYAVNQTVRKFCLSADGEIEPRHFERLPKFETLPTDEFMGLRTRVLRYARELWEQQHDPKGAPPLGHDGYVKAWQLSSPVIDTCACLVDEFQDTNPVLLDVLSKQDCQIVGVGDPHQQIYEWRGAVNAMELVKTDIEVALTKSFRFGQAIADAASQILAVLGETVRIQGNERIISSLSSAGQKTIICRTNGEILDRLISIKEAKLGTDVFVQGGVLELSNLLQGVERLQAKKTSTIPLFLGFNDWDEFLDYVEKSGDGEAKKLVKLIDKFGLYQLKGAINTVRDSEDMSEVILTTGHKSKGREWEGVELAEDFKEQPEKTEDGDSIHNPSETRLFYVAATRGIERLKLPGWAYGAYGIARPVTSIAEGTPAA